MILHWSPRSPFVRKVMICAHETGLVNRLELVRSVASMLRPNLPLMQVNPWSKIPTLVTDEGQGLFDSDVIIEYLDSLHQGPKLRPADPGDRWRALRWGAYGNEMLHALVLWRNERERPRGQQLQQLLAAFDFKMQEGLAMLEHECEAMARAPYGVGHIALGCALGYADFRFPDLGWRVGRPCLAAWFEVFSARPSSQLTRPVDDSIGAPDRA